MGQQRKRRSPGYLDIVEANLREIERAARALSSDYDADVTPADMWGVLVSARRALRALGYDFPHPLAYGALSDDQTLVEA
jgi:hypothetical protein